MLEWAEDYDVERDQARGGTEPQRLRERGDAEQIRHARGGSTGGA